MAGVYRITARRGICHVALERRQRLGEMITRPALNEVAGGMKGEILYLRLELCRSIGKQMAPQ